jgi:alcohol dehydrogenase class IV
MRFNAPVTTAGLGLISDALDSGPAVAGSVEDRAVGAVKRFLASLAVPARLREAGLSRAALAEVAEHAMDDWAITRVPRQPDRSELDGLLNAAW